MPLLVTMQSEARAVPPALLMPLFVLFDTIEFSTLSSGVPAATTETQKPFRLPLATLFRTDALVPSTPSTPQPPLFSKRDRSMDTATLPDAGAARTPASAEFRKMVSVT